MRDKERTACHHKGSQAIPPILIWKKIQDTIRSRPIILATKRIPIKRTISQMDGNNGRVRHGV